MASTMAPNEPQFVSKGNPAGTDIGGSNGFMDNSSTSLGMGEPMGELDGTISNLAMSAKYNLTQMTPKQASFELPLILTN